MDSFYLLPHDRTRLERVRVELELAVDALQHTCAYTSVLENIDMTLPGLQELHVHAYMPQSYGLNTALGAVKAMLAENVFSLQYGLLVSGCLNYVLGFYNTAIQDFQRVELAASSYEEKDLLNKAGQHGPNIKTHAETALDLLRQILGTEDFAVVVEAGQEFQERLGHYRQIHGLDCAPAAY